MKKLLVVLTLLMTNMAIAITDITLDQKLEAIQSAVDGGKPAVIEFYATWCGPCQMLKPMVLQAEKDLGDKVNFFSIDVDKSFIGKDVHIVPMVIVVKGKQMSDPIVGVPSSQQSLEDQILERLK
jgi:thioredoxin 1